jgi:hypothetical protein
MEARRAGGSERVKTMATKIKEITTEVMFSDDQTTACISGFYKGELVIQEIATLETPTHSYSAAKFIPGIRNKVRKAVGI